MKKGRKEWSEIKETADDGRNDDDDDDEAGGDKSVRNTNASRARRTTEKK